ncbi:MAG: isoprenylcysteine carboxylmethyltransferase family protein [Bacteroidota bacterium]|nr:isoprenylcysteine carboxylmethyltransferase family protein [Bacteroidota bacterium]
MTINSVKLNIFGIRGIIREFAAAIIGAVVLFTSAGTTCWGRAWIYISIAFLYQGIYISTLMIINPQLLNERGHLNWKETKHYDKYFIIFYPIFTYASLIVAGLDVTRFKWSNIPFIMIYPGLLVFILSCALGLWAYISNTNFILTQRNDKISDQQVCTTGPYRYIRHPGYLAAILSSFCYPFIIGSLFSFIPVSLNIILIILRTNYEDKTLKIELNGYDEYSRITKYMLIPHLSHQSKTMTKKDTPDGK